VRRVTIPIVAPDAVRRVNQVVDRIRRKLRPISLNSPWDARFVPEALVPDLQRLLAGEDDVLRQAVRKAADSALDATEFRDLAERDATKVVEKLKPANPDDVRSQLVTRALKAHEDFVRTCPPPLNAWIELGTAPSLDGDGRAGPAELRERIRLSQEDEWVRWLTTVAGAPRRSLRKYQNPERAAALCILPDPKLKQLTGQTELRLGTDAHEKPLEEQIEEIQRWRGERLATVRQRLAVLLELDSA
jgi:hypothetical protein